MGAASQTRKSAGPPPGKEKHNWRGQEKESLLSGGFENVVTSSVVCAAERAAGCAAGSAAGDA